MAMWCADYHGVSMRQLDMAKVAEGGQNPNTTFNLVMRRKPKENNFKAVLKTIRDLMQSRYAP